MAFLVVNEHHRVIQDTNPILNLIVNGFKLVTCPHSLLIWQMLLELLILLGKLLTKLLLLFDPLDLPLMILI